MSKDAEDRNNMTCDYAININNHQTDLSKFVAN